MATLAGNRINSSHELLFISLKTSTRRGKIEIVSADIARCIILLLKPFEESSYPAKLLRRRRHKSAHSGSVRERERGIEGDREEEEAEIFRQSANANRK